MKISKSKLVSMIKESIIRQLLNEARSYAYDTYTPYDPGFLTDEEKAEIAKLDGTKKYYEPDEATVEKYASMHLPFEG